MRRKPSTAHGKPTGPGGLRALLCDMEDTFGVPGMSLPLLALAPWPRFLPLAWRALKPAVDTGEFFHAAQRLHADAYTRMFNYFSIPALRARETGRESSEPDLDQLLELFQTRTALLLLFFSLEAQALEGPVGYSGVPSPAPARPLFPGPRWREELEVQGRNESSQSPEFLAKSPYANPEYRILRRWPAFFQSYRNSLGTVVASPLYEDWRLNTRSLAWRLAQELPVRVQISHEAVRGAALQERDLSSIATAHQIFLENLSELLLNMAVARIGLEKGSLPAAASAAAQHKALPDKPGRVA